jgi:hypothetical protein
VTPSLRVTSPDATVESIASLRDRGGWFRAQVPASASELRLHLRDDSGVHRLRALWAHSAPVRRRAPPRRARPRRRGNPRPELDRRGDRPPRWELRGAPPGDRPGGRRARASRGRRVRPRELQRTRLGPRRPGLDDHLGPHRESAATSSVSRWFRAASRCATRATRCCCAPPARARSAHLVAGDRVGSRPGGRRVTLGAEATRGSARVVAPSRNALGRPRLTAPTSASLSLRCCVPASPPCLATPLGQRIARGRLAPPELPPVPRAMGRPRGGRPSIVAARAQRMPALCVLGLAVSVALEAALLLGAGLASGPASLRSLAGDRRDRLGVLVAGISTLLLMGVADGAGGTTTCP